MAAMYNENHCKNARLQESGEQQQQILTATSLSSPHRGHRHCMRHLGAVSPASPRMESREPAPPPSPPPPRDGRLLRRGETPVAGASPFGPLALLRYPPLRGQDDCVRKLPQAGVRVLRADARVDG